MIIEKGEQTIDSVLTYVHLVEYVTALLILLKNKRN